MTQPVATIAAVLQAVRAERLWQHLMEMASIGATGRGGVNRQALTPEDTEARARLLTWAANRGFRASADAIGNVFIRRPGSDPTANPVVAGSHLDTQPTGGNFDGVYGVLAAFEVLEAAADAGVTTSHLRWKPSSGPTRREPAFSPPPWVRRCLPGPCL